MIRLTGLLCMSAVLVLHAEPVAAEGNDKAHLPATRPSDISAPRPQPRLSGEYALMAAEVRLTDKQKTQLKTIVIEELDAETRMQAVNQEKLEKLQKDLADARKAKNIDAISNILQHIMRIKAAETKAKKAFAKRAMELLTPEQKDKWAGFVLYRLICKPLSRVRLTDDQKTTIRGLCDDAAVELGDDALKTSLKMVVAQKKLRDEIKAQVLTEVQRKSLGLRPTKPHRTPRAKPSRPVKPLRKPVKPVKQPRAKR